MWGFKLALWEIVKPPNPFLNSVSFTTFHNKLLIGPARGNKIVTCQENYNELLGDIKIHSRTFLIEIITKSVARRTLFMPMTSKEG